MTTRQCHVGASSSRVRAAPLMIHFTHIPLPELFTSTNELLSKCFHSRPGPKCVSASVEGCDERDTAAPTRVRANWEKQDPV